MEQKDPHSSYLEIMRRLSTDIYGLKFRPTLEPNKVDETDNNLDSRRLHWEPPEDQPYLDDDRDWPMKNLWGHPDNGWPSPPVEVSDENYVVSEEVVKSLGDRCKVIVEIGVNRNGDRSMTQAYLKNKSSDCIYFGIDMESKVFLNDTENNIHTITANSFEQDRIRTAMKEIGIEKIDILAIDGWHSVNTAINDWKYADMLSDHGVVVLHDTNTHPGPVLLFEAVDENLFDKQRHCTDYIDYGIATFKKK
jgi:hypothetical protein